MRNLAALFAALARSRFRSSFRLSADDMAYVRDKGLPLVMRYAADFIDHRLAPSHIANDGKQTPFRGHPVFVAQHAAACCCRSCLQKWHHVPAGHAFSTAEKHYVLSVLQHWMQLQLQATFG